MLAKLHASQTILPPALSPRDPLDSRCIFAFDSEGGASRALETDLHTRNRMPPPLSVRF